LVGQGVAVFGASKGNPKAGAEKAASFFEQALEVDKDCTDALVNLAVVNMWKGGVAGVKAAGERCKQALAAAQPASLYAQQQLYAVSGLVELQNDRAEGATTDFLRAKAIAPSAAQMDDYRRAALLGAAVQEGVEAMRRKEMLLQCETELRNFGKDQVTALNALGYGWWLLRNDPLVAVSAGGAGRAAPTAGAAAAGALVSAQNKFNKAMETDAKDLRAYYNMAGLIEAAMTETAAKASVPLRGFGGGKDETPVNPWVGEPRQQQQRVPPADMQYVVEITKRLKEEAELWKRFLLKANPGTQERLDAKLRQLSCYRRQAAIQEGVNNSERQLVMAQAMTLAQDIVKQHPESGDGHFAYGRVLYDKGDFAGALKEFKEAQAKGLKDPAVERLVKGLGQQPEALDVRPSPDRRWFGSRPLIACTLKTVSSAGPLKRVTIKMGQKALNATLVGSQVLCLPGANDVMDGDQTVTIEAADALNNAVEFPPLKFAIDRKPPTCRVEPEAGGISTRQVFKISVSDSSGVDYSSVKVVLKPLGRGAGNTMRTLIDEGKYKVNMGNLNPARKPGYTLDSESFEVEPGLQEMGVGDWELTISVQDMAGNAAQETKKYTVK
jgi:tetratricopeptide (TPR) repeat protein